MKKVITVNELPKDEKIYFRKGWDGWRVIHPYKDENGKIIWANVLFGGKGNLVRLIIYALLGIGIYFGMSTLLGNCQLMADNPCKYCEEYLGRVVQNFNP